MLTLLVIKTIDIIKFVMFKKGRLMKVINIRVESNLYLSCAFHSVEKPKARIVITHGIMEHSGRYQHIVDFFNNENFDVVTYDLRGHGQSGGDRAHVEKFSDFVSDLQLVFEESIKNNPELPVIFLGHSMGGLISYLHSLQKNSYSEKISGYVILSPAMSMPALSFIEKIKLFFARLLRPIIPKKTEKVGLLSEELMTDPYQQELHRSDKKVMSKATISLLLELLGQSAKVSKDLRVAQKPSLFLQGDLDTVVNAKSNIEVFKVLKSSSNGVSHFDIFQGELHELLNSHLETRQKVFTKILTFTNKALQLNTKK